MKKHYLNRIPLSLLDTFLVLFYVYISKKYYGMGTDFGVFLVFMVIIPIVCKTTSLIITKDDDKLRKVKYHIYHLLSAYIILCCTVFIFNNVFKLNQILVLSITIVVLVICYITFGEYYFRLRIVPERIRELSHKLNEQFSEYDDKCEDFLLNENDLEITIIISQEDHLIDFNLKDIVVKGERNDELFEESDTER